MPSVREILQQSGVDEYTINSLDQNVMTGFANVLAEAESQKISVDKFWKETYAPGISQWESEKADLAKRIAATEARNAALETERRVLAEQGVITGDSMGQPRDNGTGRFTTPGTPAFSGDANDIVSRVATGVGSILDITHKYQQLYGTTLPVNPSALIAEADRAGISPMEYANRQFKFAEKERQQYEDQIRRDERTKADKEWSERTGANPDVRQPNGAAGMTAIRKATESGQRQSPLGKSLEDRRAMTRAAVHRDLAERETRDA